MKLKNILLASVIGMLSINAQAIELAPVEYCKAQAELGESIMKFQQSGKPRKLADTVITSEQGQAMLDWAYSLPREKTFPEQKSSVDSFKEAVRSTCLGAFADKKVDGISI